MPSPAPDRECITRVCKNNPSLKHKVNGCVLSLSLNTCKQSASRTAAGRLFLPYNWAGHRDSSVTRFQVSYLGFTELVTLTNCLISVSVLKCSCIHKLPSATVDKSADGCTEITILI